MESYLKKPWKFYKFTQLLEYEAFINKLREEIYQNCEEIQTFSIKRVPELLLRHEKKLINLLRGLRAVLEQSNFLDLKINYDFLLNPPAKYPSSSLIAPLLYSDNPKVSFEILMTLNALNTLGENLKGMNSNDRTILSMQLTAYLNTIDLSTKRPLMALIQGLRSEEDKAKLAVLSEKLGLELDDFNDEEITSFLILRNKGEIIENQFILEQLMNLSKIKTMRFFSNSSYRVFFAIQLLLTSELILNGVKLIGNEFIESFNNIFKEEKRSLLIHTIEQMTRMFRYNAFESPDLSNYIFEALQLSGFSYDQLITEARTNGRMSFSMENREFSEGTLIRKLLELWPKKPPFFHNKQNIVGFLKLADKLRFSYENLEAQMKGVDIRGLLNFSEEEKRLLDKLIELIALEVLSNEKHLENIEFLVPIIIYFKTVYNQEESKLFQLLYHILQDLIMKSLENHEDIELTRKKFGFNLIEESILQLLQLFFVFEIRNEATEKLNKNLLNRDFFILLEKSIENQDKIAISHFIFNQVLFHSLTNDNNIIRDFLIESLENDGNFQRFLKIFQVFFEENKVVFLCNFNLLRKKVLRICEDSGHKFELMSLDGRNLQLARLYSQIFTSCFLLWADTSSLDNDFLEITCLKNLYEESLIAIMRKLREIAILDERNFIEMLEKINKSEDFKSFFIIYCDSLQKKYKLIIENLLYYMRAVIMKLYENDLNGDFFLEFLKTFAALSHPLILSLNKDYHLSRIHSLFESNFTLNHDRSRLMTYCLDFLAQILQETEEFPLQELISLNETPLKYYEKILSKGIPHWKSLRQAKKLEMALILNIGLLRKPLFAESLLNFESLNLSFEVSQKIANLFQQLKAVFFSEIEGIIEEFSEENMEIEHYCNVHPQNDFSRKIVHKSGLIRQLGKFLISILKIKTRGVLGSEIKKLQDFVCQMLAKGNLIEILDYSENEGKSKIFILKTVFLFDEIRRFSIFMHESKLPHVFLSEEILMKMADLIRKMQVFNQENNIKHESLLPSLDLISRMNFYFFCRILLNFLSEFLIKSLLFNEFSFILESDFTLFINIVFEKVLKAVFLYWKGFFKSNEEIPLKLIKLIENLNSKSLTINSFKATNVLSIKPRNKTRLLQLNHAILQVFLESTYQIGLRIRSIYFYKLLHIICLLNDNKESTFSQIKIPYLAYFIKLLEKHFQAISPDWNIENSPVMLNIIRNSLPPQNNKKSEKALNLFNLKENTKEKTIEMGTDLFLNKSEKLPYLDPIIDSNYLTIPTKSPIYLDRNSFLFEKNSYACKPTCSSMNFPLFDPLDLIAHMGTIESACIQAMLTNLISRLLFSERQWDSDPALQPGLREMYWNWNATNDFAKYVNLLLEKLSKEKAILKEEELDTLHNDTIGNLIEMLKENLPEISKNNNKLKIEEFLEVCFDFLNKYFNQQKVQMNSIDKTANVNVIRQEILRDLIGIIGSGLLSLSNKAKKHEKIKKKIFEVLFIGFKDLRMYRESGFHEKFSQEFLRLIEILILDNNEEIRNGSIEFLIKSAFYDSKNSLFKTRIHYKEIMKENIEKSFNSNGRFFVNSLYKLCLIFDEKEAKIPENSENLKENKGEDVYISLRKGIIPEEIQGIEENYKKNSGYEKYLSLFMLNSLELVIENIERKSEEKPKMLDLDLSVKILVLIMGKYPTLMPFCLEYQMKINISNMKLSDLQKERIFFARKALGSSNDLKKETLADEVSMNFLEFCYIFYDQKPHVFRQFLMLFCNQDFNYLRISEKTLVSSGKIIKKSLIELFSGEILRFISRLGGLKNIRYLENTDEILALRNLMNLYYKILLNKGHYLEENPGFLKEKLLEFLEILLEILRKISHPLDLIVLRDINYFAYLANVYKQIIKISFHIKTGLFYSKSNEYLKYYLNKHLKTFFMKTNPEFANLSRFNKNPCFHNLIFAHSSETSTYQQQILNYSELFPRLLLQKRPVSSKKAEWLLMKEKEIHDYSKNVTIFNQQSMNHAKLFLETREDLRRLAPNNPDLNIYENLKNLIKAGILNEPEKLLLSRENYDQNSLKYIVWPTNPSIWLEKMQDFHVKAANNKKIYLTLEQMVFELRSLTHEIKLALKNEALKYAMEVEENSENMINELQTQSCLTIFGCEDMVLDQYYQNITSEISTFHERKFNSEQNVFEYFSEDDEENCYESLEKTEKKEKNEEKDNNELIEKTEKKAKKRKHKKGLEDLEKEEVFSAKGPFFDKRANNVENYEEMDSEKTFQKSYLKRNYCLDRDSLEKSEENGEKSEENEEKSEENEEKSEENEEKSEENEEKSEENEEKSEENEEENEKQSEENEEEDEIEEDSGLKEEKSRKSTEMDEESKELPEDNNNTPTFLDKYGIDQGYFNLIPEEMREEVLEGARESYEDRHFDDNLHNNNSGFNLNLTAANNDKLRLENLKKFKLLLLRETDLIEKNPNFTNISNEKKEIQAIEKILDNMSYSLKKKVFLQADKSFLRSCNEKIQREAEEILKEIHKEEVQSFEENESSKDEETLDNFENEYSEDEEEEKNQNNHSLSNNNNNDNNECRSLKFIDEDNVNNQENLSNLAESSNNSDSKLMEKAFLTDEFKRPQTSFLKKLGIEKSDKFESEGGRKPRNKTKRKVTGKKSGLKERFLFKNYKKIKEIDENLNKIDFFLELPEIDDDLLAKLFEMFHYSLVLTENSSQLALKSLFKLFKTLLFNPYNAYKLIDGLVFMLFHYSEADYEEEKGIFSNIGYGLIETYPLITKKEIINSGVLNNLFSMINKLVENHYCLPLFLQAKIEKDKPLFFKDMMSSRDYSMSFIKTLRKTHFLEKNHDFSQAKDHVFLLNQRNPDYKASEKQANLPRIIIEKSGSFLEKPDSLLEKSDYILEKRSSFRDNIENSSESMTILNLLISYLTLYEGNGFLSYLNGDILLTLIKNFLKLSVINDGFLSQKIVKYPKYKIEAPLYDSQDIISLCQIFYQKRIRLKYFDSSYYELFVEYSKSPLNFERFFLALMNNYTSKFNEEMELIKTKAIEFAAEKHEIKNDIKLKAFWETVLLTNSHNNSLSEDFHIFRHIVKDLVVLFETPLKIFYEETVYKEFHKTFGISVKDLEKEDAETWKNQENSEKSYLKEWLSKQKTKKKDAFLGHLREKIMRNTAIIRFYELTVEILKLMVGIFGVEFQDFGTFENERLEDCYYFFIYPIKSLLILYNFLNFSQEESFCNDLIGISGIKTREILKSEKEFSEKECHSDQYSNNNSGYLSQKPSQGSDIYSLKAMNLNNKLERIFNILLTPNFLKLITFFMQSKAEPDKLGNYLDYIRRAKKKASLSLEIKLGYLRSFSKIKAITNKSHNSRFLDEPLTLYINRQTIWNSTLETLLMISSEELALRPLKIVFEGEEGIDYGGITREWLSLLNKELFDPNFGLFKLSANRVSYQPNPLSYVIPDHLTHFREVGRLIGKVILDNLNIEVNFVQSFLKHIIGQTLYIKDLSSIDPDLCKNLEWILENDVKDLDLTFAYDLDYFDVPKTIELIENGQNLRVNEFNKKEYVKQMCYAKMASEIKAQTEAFLTGFLSLIPREALSLIDDKELGMKLCGTSEIDRKIN